LYIGGKKISIHQLVAISGGADPYKVYGNSSYNVDHKNGCKIDNRESNLELLSVKEHGQKDGGSWEVKSKHEELRMLSNIEKETKLNPKEVVDIAYDS
jgi:hypothetical protein